MVKEQNEWEFSNETKFDWSKMLVTFLFAVDAAIEELKWAQEMGKKGEKEVHDAMTGATCSVILSPGKLELFRIYW